jgi:hypothetical protein
VTATLRALGDNHVRTRLGGVLRFGQRRRHVQHTCATVMGPRKQRAQILVGPPPRGRKHGSPRPEHGLDLVVAAHEQQQIETERLVGELAYPIGERRDLSRRAARNTLNAKPACVGDGGYQFRTGTGTHAAQRYRMANSQQLARARSQHGTASFGNRAMHSAQCSWYEPTTAADGQGQRVRDGHFGYDADDLAQRLVKGSEVYIEGRLKTNVCTLPRARHGAG